MESPLNPNNKTNLVVFLIVLILMLGLSVYLMLPFVLSIVMGTMICLMLKPYHEKMILKGMKPRVAASFLTLGTVLLLLLPIVVLAVLAVKQGAVIAQAISQDERFSSHEMIARISEWPPVHAFFDDADALETEVGSWMTEGLKFVSGGMLILFSGIPSVLLQLVLTCISCFVFLVNGERFSDWMSDKIPLEFEVRKQMVSSFRDTAVSTIWATLAAGTAQSLVMFTGFMILNIPASFLAAGLTFILAWIPLVGCSPVWVVAAIYLIANGMVGKAVAIVLFGLSAGILDNIIRAMILNGRSKMHPLIGLLSIFGGIGLFGVMGVFVGPVIASLMISLLMLWSKIGHRYGLLPKVDSSSKQ